MSPACELLKGCVLGKSLDLARPERFELPTYCSGGNRSIQLSYGRASQQVYIVAISAAIRQGSRKSADAHTPASGTEVTSAGENREYRG